MSERDNYEEIDLNPAEEAALERAWQKRDQIVATQHSQNLLAPMPLNTPLPSIQVSLRKSISLPTPPVTHLVNASNGSRVIVSNYKWQASLWDTAHNNCLAQYSEFTSPVMFSGDGKMFAAGVSQNNSVALFTSEGILITTLFFDGNHPFHSVTFAPSQLLVAGATNDTEVVIWSNTGHIEKVLSHPLAKVHEIAFAPDNTLLATSDSAGIIYLWEVGTWRLLAQFSGIGEDGGIARLPASEKLQFTEDSRLLSLRKNRPNGPLVLWDIRPVFSGSKSLAIASYNNGRIDQSLLTGHIIADIDVNSVHFFDSSTQNFLGTFTTPNRISLVNSVTSHSVPMALSPSSRFVAIGGEVTGEIWIWDIAHQQNVASFSAYSRLSPETSKIDALINSLSWNKDENMLITLGSDEEAPQDSSSRKRNMLKDAIKLWDIKIV